MKLAVKVVLAVLAAVLVVLVVFGYVRVQREVALFDSDMRRDHRLIGSTLAVCVQDTWRFSGPARALKLVDLADVGQPGINIGWLDRDGRRAQPGPARTKGPPAFDRVDQSIVPSSGSDKSTYLLTRVPVVGEGGLAGAIEITEVLLPRDRYVRTSITNTVFAVVAMFVVSAPIVLLLGVWLIGRPLDQLAAKARRVGEGDLSAPLAVREGDEIGELALEVNAMCEHLARAKARAAEETEAKFLALDQLRHADRLITVGTLAAGIAHELGTPLNVVAGRARLVERGKVPPEKVADACRVIAVQADRMATIIRQLLDFARPREPKKRATDLAPIARATASLLTPMADAEQVDIVVAGGVVRAMADGIQIEQVATNLVVNALHASSPGGTIEIWTGIEQAERASLDGTGPRDWAILRVRDTGHGMPADLVEHVFEPFFTTKEVGSGVGLGLSVAHGIVEEHDGFIRVESEVGRGTCFSVYLPLEASR